MIISHLGWRVKENRRVKLAMLNSSGTRILARNYLKSASKRPYIWPDFDLFDTIGTLTYLTFAIHEPRISFSISILHNSSLV